MLARFLATYPGYTAETALQMPWRRFMALVRAIPAVVAEQQLRLLQTMVVAVNPGEHGESYYGLVEELQEVVSRQSSVDRGREQGAGGRGQGGPAVVPGMSPAVMWEAEPGSIEAEMARQKAAWEEMQRDRRRLTADSRTPTTEAGG